jgi:hypothetical protein
MRRIAENDRSAVADATGSVSAKWKQEIIYGNAAEKKWTAYCKHLWQLMVDRPNLHPTYF